MCKKTYTKFKRQTKRTKAREKTPKNGDTEKSFYLPIHLSGWIFHMYNCTRLERIINKSKWKEHQADEESVLTILKKNTFFVFLVIFVGYCKTGGIGTKTNVLYSKAKNFILFALIMSYMCNCTTFT